MIDEKTLMPQPRQALSTERGSEEATLRLAEVLELNFDAAKIQLGRYKRSDLVLLVSTCADVRVGFKVTPTVQATLSRILDRETVIFPLGALAAGQTSSHLRNLADAQKVAGKEALVLHLPHCEAPGVCGCEGIKMRELAPPLPPGLRASVDLHVQGESTETHMDGLAQGLLRAKLPGVVALYAHGSRRFLHDQTRLTNNSPLARELATFFQTPSPMLMGLQESVGLPTGMDVDSEDAPAMVIEIGSTLLPLGGAPMLLAQTSEHWGNSAIITAQEKKEDIRNAVFTALLPLFAKAGGKFASLQSLVVMAPASWHPLIRSFIADAESELGRFSPDSDFYGHIVLIDSTSFGAALGGPTAAGEQAAARTKSVVSEAPARRMNLASRFFGGILGQP